MWCVEKSVVSRTSINPRYKIQTFTPSFIWQISISIISQILFRMTSGHDRFTVANFPSQCNSNNEKDETFLDTVHQDGGNNRKKLFYQPNFLLRGSSRSWYWGDASTKHVVLLRLKKKNKKIIRFESLK